jgi:hypothetical protein
VPQLLLVNFLPVCHRRSLLGSLSSTALVPESRWGVLFVQNIRTSSLVVVKNVAISFQYSWSRLIGVRVVSRKHHIKRYTCKYRPSYGTYMRIQYTYCPLSYSVSCFSFFTMIFSSVSRRMSPCSSLISADITHDAKLPSLTCSR